MGIPGTGNGGIGIPRPPGGGKGNGGAGIPGTANGGGIPPGKAPGKGGGATPGFWPSIGFDADCPSAAYEEVMESMTDWAFSWPIC